MLKKSHLTVAFFISLKIILFENQLVIKNIKNKFGDTIKKYLHLQNIKLKNFQ